MDEMEGVCVCESLVVNCEGCEFEVVVVVLVKNTSLFLVKEGRKKERKKERKSLGKKDVQTRRTFIGDCGNGELPLRIYGLKIILAYHFVLDR